MACIDLTSIFLWSALLTHTVIIVEAQSFEVFPSNTCAPCGGSTKFDCTTTAIHALVGGRLVKGVGGQLWRIQSPNGTVITLSSSMPDNLPAGFEFISLYPDEYTGLRVLDTNLHWNGTTFQCVAFTPSNVEQQNTSAATVTLEVGGPPHEFSCRCQCPDVHRSRTSDQCTIMWKRPLTVSCSPLQQFNVSLTGPDGTLVYSDSFGQGTTTTNTISLKSNTVYRTAITAENVCGNTTCVTNCSTVPIDEPATFVVTSQVVPQISAQKLINVTWTVPGPGDPLVDSYTASISSTDGQQLCGSQTTGGNATSVVLDVTDCVLCQGFNKSYSITVEASNRGGQTTATTSLTSHIQRYQVHSVYVGGQCALNISCTVHDRTVATGCVFMYDSNEDGTLDSETFIILPTVGNTAERHLIIDCNLNQLNFTVRAVSGITLFTTIPLDCAISSLHRVSSTESVDPDPASAIGDLSAGGVVGISASVFLVSFSAGVVLAALITYCCCVIGRGKNRKQSHLSSSEGAQTVPVYDEVRAGPVNELDLKQNPSYEVGRGKMEMKQNPSYGPVGY